MSLLHRIHPLTVIMKYTLQKIGLVVFCSFFVLVGLAMLLPDKDGFEWGQSAFMGMAFVAMAAFTMVRGVMRINKFQKKTYLWYKASYPLNVDGNRVTCFSCGSPRINARGLMNHSYHREHYCTQCGATLYYSPEGK